ncbi:chloride channel protein [Actinacidiphila bryophytorum]|uniref:chloride channel protein n=1 Tax=Actinacidiphila bryophytorum TaxID=1436133 RepID=UPI00396A79B0
MTQQQPAPADAPPGNQPKEADELRAILRRPEYRRALVFSGLIGIPVSLVAFFFLAGLHELEHLIWTSWPHHLGHRNPPWWWPLPMAAVAGLGTSLVVLRFPGRGGHIPAAGLHSGGATKAALPGVVLAAACCLPFGVVLGPEAPLIALGTGLALLFRDLARAPATQASTTLLGAAGAAAGIAAIFGNALVAAVLLMEVAGVGGPQLFAVMLPALLSSGVGGIVFTGFGHWTGLKTGSLEIGLPAPPLLDAGDVVWSVLMAVVIGTVIHYVMTAGRHIAVLVAAHTLRTTVLCALAVGGCAAAYSGITGRSPTDVALSGQAALPQLAADPHSWPVSALIAVLAFKSAAYAISLGSLRGGPVFPSLFLGAAAGVLLAPLPGLGVIPGMAAGMAAASAAALRLPVSTVVLVALLLGHTGSLPVVILAAVTAFVTVELLPEGPPIPAFPPRRGKHP